jgi:hypothetical protein
MGKTIGLILVKSNNSKNVSNEIITNIFENDFNEIPEKELRKIDFNFRDQDSFSLIKSEGVFGIENIPMVVNILENQDAQVLIKIYEICDNPQQIFIYIEDNSSSSYGYGVFENGKLIRTFYSVEDGIKIIEFGEALEFEKNWKYGIVDFKWDSSDEIDLSIITNKKTKEKICKVNLAEKLSSDFFYIFFNSNIEDFLDNSSKKSFFKLKTKNSLNQNDIRFSKFNFINKVLKFIEKKPFTFLLIFFISLVIYHFLKFVFIILGDLYLGKLKF